MTDDVEMATEQGAPDGERGGRRLKSTVQSAGRTTKGRGLKNNMGDDDRFGGHFDSLDDAASDAQGPQKSVEGWVLFVTGVHEEATNDDLQDAFAEYAVVKNIWMNLDRQTGFVKGYALVEFKTKEEAEAAMDGLDGTEVLGQKINVGWAFVRPGGAGGRRNNGRRR